MTFATFLLNKGDDTDLEETKNLNHVAYNTWVETMRPDYEYTLSSIQWLPKYLPKQ